MQPNQQEIIAFALKLRQNGQIIDRDAFNQISDWEYLEDCMRVWHHYLNSPDCEQPGLFDKQASQQIQQSFADLHSYFEQQQLKLQKQAEEKLESLHRQASIQHEQSLIQHNKLIEQVSQLKESIAVLQTQNNQLQSDFDQIYCQAEQSRHLIDQKEEENRSLWRQLEEVTSELDEQRVILSEQLNEQKYSHTSESLHHRLLETKWHEQINQQASLISEQIEEIKTLKANLQQAQQALKFAAEQHQTDTEKQYSSQQDQAHTSASLRQEISKLTKENLSLSQQLEARQQEYTEHSRGLNKQITELSEQNAHLSSQLDDKTKQQQASANASGEKHQQLLQKVKELEDKYSQTQILVARQEEQIHHLQNEQEYKLEQLAQVHARALEHEQYQLKVKTEQQQKLEQKAMQLQAELDKQIQAYETLAGENRQHNKQNQARIKTLNQDIKAYQKQIKTLELARDNLADELNLAKSKHISHTDKLNYELENAHKSIQLLKAEIKQLQSGYQQV